MAFGDAGSYARFMGRFSEPLAPLFADLVEARPGDDVLDVGCGPGVLTEVLVERFGAEHVTAIDPAPGFVEAAKQRLPGVDVRQGTAEDMPYPDGRFDATFAQLVVHFMTDAAAGVGEMSRVTRAGGVVATCVWDHGGGRGPLSPFWTAVAELDPDGVSEPSTGSNAGDLERLLVEAGLEDVTGGELSVTVTMPTFEEWWTPYLERTGSAGDYLAGQTPEQVAALEELCRGRLGAGPFDVVGWTWTATGRVPTG